MHLLILTLINLVGFLPSTHSIDTMNTPQIDFASLKQASWTAEELQNASTLVDFMQHLMNDHQFDYILEKYGHLNYVQHNRSIPDGIEGLVGYIRTVIKRFPEYAYEVKRIICTGDYVVFHSHLTFKKKHRGNEKKGFLVSDTWRLENGEIAEHWDALQPLDGGTRFLFYLSGGKIRNSNSIF